MQARQRFFNLVVTNVPGPQFPLYLLGHRLQVLYPVVPLARRQALGIAVMSYDGHLGFGLLADYDALPGLEGIVRDLRLAIASLARAAGIPAKRPQARGTTSRAGAAQRNGARSPRKAAAGARANGAKHTARKAAGSRADGAKPRAGNKVAAASPANSAKPASSKAAAASPANGAKPRRKATASGNDRASLGKSSRRAELTG